MAITRPTRKSMHSEALPLIWFGSPVGRNAGLSETLSAIELEVLKT